MDPKETVKLSTDLGLVALVEEESGFAFGPTFKNEWEAEAFLEFLNEEGIGNPFELARSDWERLTYEFFYG